MARKFVIYLEGVSRGIVITDDDESITTDTLAQQLTSKMLGYDMCEFKTSTDCLIVRPSQITGVHIQGNNFNTVTPKTKTSKIIKKIEEVVPQLELDDLPEMDDEFEINDNEQDQTETESIEETTDEIQTVEDEVDAWHSEINK